MSRHYSEHPYSDDDLMAAEMAQINAAVAKWEYERMVMDPVERARLHGCRWWRAGKGIVVDGPWVVRPATVVMR